MVDDTYAFVDNCIDDLEGIMLSAQDAQLTEALEKALDLFFKNPNSRSLTRVLDVGDEINRHFILLTARARSLKAQIRDQCGEEMLKKYTVPEENR